MTEKICPKPNTVNMGKLFVTLFAGSQPSTGTSNQPGTRTRSSTRNNVFCNWTIFWLRYKLVLRPLRYCLLPISSTWTNFQSLIKLVPRPRQYSRSFVPRRQKVRHTWLATGTAFRLKHRDKWPDGCAR